MLKKSRLSLKKNPVLKDFQVYVDLMEKERGFAKNSNLQTALGLAEELGELIKAIRRAEKLRTYKKSAYFNLSEELADVLIYLSAIANRYNIDLEKSFRDKEKINKKRTWS